MSVDFFGVGGPGQIGDIKKPQKAQANKKTEGSQGSDQVQFSSVLQDVNKAQETPASTSSERADRVAELKAQVADGSYKPDLNKVASSLLEFLIQEK
jgi:negative regulator of flagellin synthesis FlgM